MNNQKKRKDIAKLQTQRRRKEMEEEQEEEERHTLQRDRRCSSYIKYCPPEAPPMPDPNPNPGLFGARRSWSGTALNRIKFL